MKLQLQHIKTWAVASLALTGFLPQVAATQSLMVNGYADFEAIVEGIGSDNKDFYFDNHHFNVTMIGQIYGDLFAAGEVEYEHAGEEIELEYGYFGYTGINNLRIMAGKFIVPFGRFNKDIHATWINKMVDRPNGFKDILPQTYSDVGLWISGAAAAGSGNRFVYDGWIVNGLMGEDGGGIRDMRGADRDELADGGRDDNKMVGARLGMDLAPLGVDFGASVQTGNYSDQSGQELTLTLLGFDAAARFADLELRAEVVRANQAATGGDLTKTGGYVQAAYRIAPKWEPVVRFSARDMPGESADRSRFSLGMNFYVSAASSVRVNYHLNSEASGFATDNDAFAMQFNIAF